MSQTTAKSGQPVRNNGGVVPRGGAATAGSPITVTSDIVVQGYRSAGVGGGNQPIASGGSNIGTIKAVTAGTFVRPMVAGQFLMMRYGFVGGNASTFLNTAAGDYGRKSIHGKVNRRSYHYTSWAIVGPSGLLTVVKGSDTNDDFGRDDAAVPTRAIPGELTYTDHGLAKTGSLAVPFNDDYKAKTG